MTVEITKRILVVPSEYNPHDENFFESFADRGITVWTHENLEPTISIFEASSTDTGRNEVDNEVVTENQNK